VERYRTLGGKRVIEKKDYARGILKALTRNEAVGILVDQNSVPSRARFVDFLRRSGVRHDGAGRSWKRTAGAAVIPGSLCGARLSTGTSCGLRPQWRSQAIKRPTQRGCRSASRRYP